LNFYTIRVIIFIVIFVVTMIIIRRVTNTITKKKAIVIVIYFIIIYQLIFYIQPEKVFLKFNSVESAMNYSFPGNKILQEIENENYMFIMYGKDQYKTSHTHFEKAGKEFKFQSPTKGFTKLYTYKEYTIAVERTNKEDALIVIQGLFLKEDKNEVIVKDSINSEFQNICFSDEYTYTKLYYSIIKNITNGYYLIIDGDVINLK